MYFIIQNFPRKGPFTLYRYFNFRGVDWLTLGKTGSPGVSFELLTQKPVLSVFQSVWNESIWGMKGLSVIIREKGFPICLWSGMFFWGGYYSWLADCDGRENDKPVLLTGCKKDSSLVVGVSPRPVRWTLGTFSYFEVARTRVKRVMFINTEKNIE